MSKQLTDEQRNCLEGLATARHAISTREATALRAALDDLDALDAANTRVPALLAHIAALARYTVHFTDCGRWKPGQICTCGLGALLNTDHNITAEEVVHSPGE